MAPSSSGLGRLPLTQKIRGSNPLGATKEKSLSKQLDKLFSFFYAVITIGADLRNLNLQKPYLSNENHSNADGCKVSNDKTEIWI